MSLCTTRIQVWEGESAWLELLNEEMMLNTLGHVEWIFFDHPVTTVQSVLSFRGDYSCLQM